MSIRTNDLSGLVDGMFNAPGMYGATPTIAQPYTFAEGVQYTPMTLNRIALSYGYMGYGLVQTLIDMPVEDAFRGGIEIESDELEEEDMEKLHHYLDHNGDWEALKEALKWGRLFGGAGLLIETEDEDTRKPLKPKALTPESMLRFIPADRWELTLTGSSILDISRTGFHHNSEQQNQVPYLYYTVPLHRTRVMRIQGKKAPSYIRLRLQGWGMSELERCMRDINSFVKFQNMIFELIDEAKIDIFKITQFNEALASAEGTEMIRRRIQLNAVLKNFKNSTVMDASDDFDQKQINLSGYADIYSELRQNLAASLQIPEAKLFGQSASGFGSGQDSIENYNAMVESGVRTTAKPIVHEIINLRCQQLFGFIPHYETKFRPLKLLNEPEEEAVMTSKINRALSLYDRQMFTAKELLDSLDKDKLLNIRTEIQDGLRDVEAVNPNMPGGAEDGDEDKADKENSLRKVIENRRNAFKMKDAAIMAKLQRK